MALQLTGKCIGLRVSSGCQLLQMHEMLFPAVSRRKYRSLWTSCSSAMASASESGLVSAH